MLRPLIFLHLPKTAGTTFNTILSRQFAGRPSHHIASDNITDNLLTLRQQSEQYRHKLALVRGHMPFGIHTALAPGARYVTVLRDPVARISSHYHYVKSTRHPLFIDAIENESMSLADYAASNLSGELENGQTRWLAGISHDKPISTEDYQQAINNIEQHFLWIGLTELFDSCLPRYAQRSGYFRLYYRSQNMGRVPNQHHAIDARTRALILSRNQFDLALHQHVLAQYTADFERNPWFQSMAERGIRVQNWLYNRVYAALKRPA